MLAGFWEDIYLQCTSVQKYYARLYVYVCVCVCLSDVRHAEHYGGKGVEVYRIITIFYLIKNMMSPER